MAYFNDADGKALMIGGAALQSAYNKFVDLHKVLYSQIRNHNLQLFPRPKNSLITPSSAASPVDNRLLTLVYFRSIDQAMMVEQSMGREGFGDETTVEAYRHPVIEIRLTPDQLAVELIISPDAWWDQQNLVGKLGIDRHRNTFRQVLRQMPDDFYFGFWGGVHLSDMHLTPSQLAYGNVLERWMATFAEGQDWLRFGAWYALDHEALTAEDIQAELFGRIRALVKVYEYVLWTSDNNFHSFYGGVQYRVGSYLEDRA